MNDSISLPAPTQSFFGPIKVWLFNHPFSTAGKGLNGIPYAIANLLIWLLAGYFTYRYFRKRRQ
jgi:hypothetical protein